MALSQPQLVELNSRMNQVFSLDEIESLCFDMGIDFDSLAGDGKGAKIRELIEFCRRRGRDEELVAKVRAERPQVAWPGAPSKLGAAPKGLTGTRGSSAIRWILMLSAKIFSPTRVWPLLYRDKGLLPVSASLASSDQSINAM